MPKESRRSQREAERNAALVALRVVEHQELDAMIARLMAKPMHERTHFLRRRLPGGGSAL